MATGRATSVGVLLLPALLLLLMPGTVAAGQGSPAAAHGEISAGWGVATARWRGRASTQHHQCALG